MKIGRTEKIWLASVLFFWVFYNFPGFPPYGSETAAPGHWEKGPGIELFRAVEQALGKRYPLIEDEEQDETAEDNTPAASETQKESDK